MVGGVTFHSLLVVKSLVTLCKIRSLLVEEAARCKKLLVTRSKIHSLLVAEAARCKKSHPRMKGFLKSG